MPSLRRRAIGTNGYPNYPRLRKIRTEWPWHIHQDFKRVFLGQTAGILAAFLSAVYENELSKVVALAFFTPVVLNLTESVSSQSVSLALQWLHGSPPSWTALLARLGSELATGFLLGPASIPVVLRWFRLEPRVAAGPIALAGADIVTILLYFNLARWLLA